MSEVEIYNRPMFKNQLHTNFKLQGKSFPSTEALILFSEEFSPAITNFLKEWFKDSETFNQRHKESLETLHDVYLLE